MELLSKLAIMTGGGIAALAADAMLPQWEQKIGQKADGTPLVTLTPGAVGALGATAAVLVARLVGLKLPAGAAPVVHSVIGGAFVVEAAKLGDEHLTPLLTGNAGTKQIASQGSTTVHTAPYNYELDQAMRQVRGASAFS